MKLLVKFTAVGNKIAIPDKQGYLDNVFNEMDKKGLIKNIVVPRYALNRSTCAVRCTSPDDTTYICSFTSEENRTTHNWEVQFEFGTYKKSMQLEISISSDDYIIAIDNIYLEKLKVAIKKIIFDDWERIIWSIDKDSEAISIDLYPLIYKTENLMRQVINEFMIKQFGPSWWDTYAIFQLQNKAKGRLGDYKSKVPSFSNVDERLMSIDIDDLGDLICLQHKKWNPKFDDIINRSLNGLDLYKETTVKKALEKQMEVEIDFWNDLFSKILPDDFKDKFDVFTKDRNHVMHNKLLDRAAYNNMRDRADYIKDALEVALVKIDSIVQPQEVKDFIEEQEELEAETRILEEDWERELKQTEAGVNIKDADEIESLFCEVLYNIYNQLTENIRFRNDIEITDSYNESGNRSDVFFTITSKVDDTTLLFKYDMDIIDAEGEKSELSISCDNGDNYSIYYTNGRAFLDEDSGLYVAEISDELTDFRNCVEEIEDTLNEELIDYQEEIDSGDIAENVFCTECGEEAIYINDDQLQKGTCLNCGYHNTICECDKCGAYFNPDDDGLYEDDEDGGISICQDCLDLCDAE